MQPSAVVSSKTHIPYQLKESPYSSHSLVLEHFPAPGEILHAHDSPGAIEAYLPILFEQHISRWTGTPTPSSSGGARYKTCT